MSFIETVNNMDEIVEWFTTRTKLHISLVQKYLDEIKALRQRRSILRTGLLPGVDPRVLDEERAKHDASKWVEPEYTPYLYVSWRYRQRDLGKTYEPPAGMQERMDAATWNHIKTNSHHPEFWDAKATRDCLNTKDRDKPADKMVNATAMPLSNVACMVADWLAMSEEKGTSVHDWIKKNGNIRWLFDENQVWLINEIADALGGGNAVES